MGRSTKRVTSKWQRFRHQDKFVREAARLDVRARSYFKLEELDQRFGLIKPGFTVLDLGASPGGWSQYVRSAIGKRGTVIAIDINPMKPLTDVEFLQLDLAQADAVAQLSNHLNHHKVDIVLSDMAPNITGNSLIDSRNYFDIYVAIFDICKTTLADSGSLVFKFFQTNETQFLKQNCQLLFKSCRVYKPKPSRSSSQETYMVAQDYQSRLAAQHQLVG